MPPVSYAILAWTLVPSVMMINTAVFIIGPVHLQQLCAVTDISWAADAVIGLAVAWDLALIAAWKPSDSDLLISRLFGIPLSSTVTRWMLLPTALGALFWATGDTLKLHISGGVMEQRQAGAIVGITLLAAGVVATATIAGIARRIVRFARP